MILIIPLFYSVYTKKEDARNVVNNQRRAISIILICVAAILGIVQVYVIPKLVNLYNSMNTAIPSPVAPSYVTGAIVVVALLSALYLLLSKPDYSRVDAIAGKYKDGEMIKTSELGDKRLDWLPIAVLLLASAYLVTTIIWPIYSLTSQYK